MLVAHVNSAVPLLVGSLVRLAENVPPPGSLESVDFPASGVAKVTVVNLIFRDGQATLRVEVDLE